MRATDDLGLTTSNTNQGRLTINVQVPGDAFPNGLLNVTGTQTGLQVAARWTWPAPPPTTSGSPACG